jgi:SAM-dependent MidA family methyltransferase
MTNKLPAPDPIAQQYSDQLLSHIKQKIAEQGGKISFADYMQHCLYYPGLGYYSAGSYKLGEQGDFTTAPEISSLFSQTLAQHISDVFSQTAQSNILEFGAGSGKMAVDILSELETNACHIDYYYIIEASADLRQRQEELINRELPHLKGKVVWLTALPENFVGVIIANEVCDAMPFHRLHFHNDNVTECYIEFKEEHLQWCEGELSQAELVNHANEILELLDGNDVITEVNLASLAWLTSLANSLKQGAIFIIDYGYPKASFYHPQRTDGTLMCYYQHQGHSNPLVLQGLQDITAHVDFTALAQVAIDNGLDIEGFQTQADFLLAGGITALASNKQHLDDMAIFKQATEIKRLTLPSEMGETFKVLSLSRSLEQPLSRCQQSDHRYTL